MRDEEETGGRKRCIGKKTDYGWKKKTELERRVEGREGMRKKSEKRRECGAESRRLVKEGG